MQFESCRTRFLSQIDVDREADWEPAGPGRGRRYLSAFERAPTLDEREGRAPSARLGQLALGRGPQRGKLVLAQSLKQPRLERGAELKRQKQIRVAWFERNHVCVDLRLLDAGFAEKRRK